MELSPDTWISLCGLAIGLGVRHGFDADHLTVIDGIARRNIQAQPTVARLAGVFFSLGHALVILVVTVVAVWLASQWRTPLWLEAGGTLVSVVFLLGLAWANLRAAWLTPPDRAVVPVGFRSRLLGRATAKDRPLAIAGVGMLFAISFDTLSQAAAISLAAAHFGGMTHALIASGAFMLGMLVASGLNGLWIAHLIVTVNRRAAHASRVMTTVIGLLNLGVGGLALAKLLSLEAGAWAQERGPFISVAVVVGSGIAFVVAMRIQRPSREQQRSHSLLSPAELGLE